MAIPTIEEVKTEVTAKEIAPFEQGIVEHLESVSTVDYSENTAITNKVVLVSFKGKEISEVGIEALEASIKAGGYTNVSVKNTTEPKRDGIGSNAAPTAPEKVVVVSFNIGAAPTPSNGSGGSSGSGSQPNTLSTGTDTSGRDAAAPSGTGTSDSNTTDRVESSASETGDAIA